MAQAASNITSVPRLPYELGRGQPDEGFQGSGTAGPRGIESVIEYNGLFLNVRDWVDTYLVTTIGGLDDADIRDSREANPGYHGETAFMGYYGGRTITLTGKIYCKTIFKLRDMQQALRRSFAQLENDLPLIFRASDPTLDMMIYCRKSQAIQMADEQRTANHFERAFLVTLRASNPRFVSSLRIWNELTFVGKAAGSYDAIGFIITNEGNFSAQPLIELTGPFSSLTLTNEDNNNQMMRLVASIPAGETWVIDIEGRRMYRKSDNANRFMYLDVNSDWMELAPEKNHIRVTAAGYSSTDSLVTFYHRHTFM